MSATLMKNEKGIVLVVVITFILIISVAMLGLFSRNISTAFSSVEQAKRLKADIIGRGAYWKAYTALSLGAGLPANETVYSDHILYTIGYSQALSQVSVQVTYP